MRYLILSDIHANIDALEAVLAAAENWEKVLVLGDLVGYGGAPNAVIDRVRGLEPVAVIRGNHDKAACGLDDGSNFNQVARFGQSEVERLLEDASIIRHRGKIEATIQNARATLALDQPLDELLWSFAPPPRDDSPTSFAEVPATTPESTAMSKQLRKLGFRFVGPTTMYALMQAAGMVDDHVAGCFRSNAARHVEEAAAAVRA